MAGHVQVTTVIDDRELAERIARVVVEERLAACAQVGAQIDSTYRWEGETRTDAEHPVTCKTAAHLADALTARIVELHPYDVPEVLVSSLLGGNAAYLAWIDAEVRGA
jgi:periplasmic divalent cation tolerance protein